MKVAKFGGTSLANATQMRKVADIVLADPDRRIVVVSAPGKAHSKDTKVTDLLIACADKMLAAGSADAELKAIKSRFAEIHKDLGLPADVMARISSDMDLRLRGDVKHRHRFADTMKAGGEDNCAWLFAALLRSMGADAHYVNPGEAGMLLSGDYGAAMVLDETYKRLNSLRAKKGIIVFPGFFGATLDGHTVTFPRGGSDITGSVVAAAVQADLYENFTDVDSVFAADPKVVRDAVPITELTYREMRELSYAGFSVFHDEAIVPAVRAGIPICIKNTNRPSAPGTLVLPERKHVTGMAVGIAGRSGFCTIFVSKYMMNREIGFGRRLLQILEEEGISYEHAPSGIDNMSLVISEGEFNSTAEDRVSKRIEKELGAEASVERGLALIMIVGEGMHYAVGMAAKATAALAKSSVNIEMMNQGSSEISMMFGVKAEDRESAVRGLYDAFFRQGNSKGQPLE
ncbi:MAG: aspartate kinase [bacterium]